jgi:ABC-type polysaccharide/polyol phosphate export permease
LVTERLRGPEIGTRSRLAYLTQRVRDLYAFRYLVRYLASSQLRVERVSFAFGFVWWLLDPLLMIAIWTFVLAGLLGRGHAPGGVPFPLFLMAAMLPWQYMNRTVMIGVSLTLNKELQMRQIAFPRAVFPLSLSISEAVKLLLALAIFPFVALAFGESLSPVQLLAVPLIPILIAITVGISWFFAALNFVFRDTQQLLSVLFRLWLFLSPVLYSLIALPARVRPIAELNPMCWILVCFRTVLVYHQIPSLPHVGEAIVAAIVTTTIGFTFFHMVEPRFARLN